MDLEKVILRQRVVDIAIYIDKEITYTGVCLKANKNVWIIVNYDYEKRTFNGFSIFRNSNVETFSIWKKNGLVVKKNNINDFNTLLPLAKMNTLYSCLKYALNVGLVALFIEGDTKSYYVGKICSVTKDVLNVRLVSRARKWSVLKKIPISKIIFFSFLSDYEVEIANFLEVNKNK